MLKVKFIQWKNHFISLHETLVKGSATFKIIKRFSKMICPQNHLNYFLHRGSERSKTQSVDNYTSASIHKVLKLQKIWIKVSNCTIFSCTIITKRMRNSIGGLLKIKQILMIIIPSYFKSLHQKSYILKIYDYIYFT